MATQLIGPWWWSAKRDKDGHREYKVRFKVKAAKTDGPANVLRTPGLPAIGSPYSLFGDSDPWAWCRPETTVEPLVQRQPYIYWNVETTFSNKPTENDDDRCHDQDIEDPLLEPQKVSGSFVKFVEEATHDLIGRITNSAFEQIRGPQVEFDNNRPTVRIQQNVAALGLETFAPMVDAVNMFPLWGMPPRTIKLSNVQWSRKLYGLCYVYYQRTFEFEVNFKGYDRVLLDEGTKALHGRWGDDGSWELINIDGEPPDPSNPSHYSRVIDRNGNPMRVILNGQGVPWIPENLDSSVEGNGVNPNDITAPSGVQACDDTAPLLRLNTNYGPFDLVGGSANDHVFRAPANGAEKIIEVRLGSLVNTDGDGLPRVRIQVFDLDCNEIAGDNVSEPTINNDVITVTATVPGDEMLVSVFQSVTVSESNTYRIKVRGEYPDVANNPGSIFVAKYPSANFLALGVPTIF